MEMAGAHRGGGSGGGGGGGGGGEDGTNYRGLAIRKGARGPNMLHMFCLSQ